MGGRRIECFSFTDDTVILAENEDELRKILKNLENTWKKYGMNINIKKTKSIILKGKNETMKMEIKGVGMEYVERLSYMGTWIMKDRCCTAGIRPRIALTKEAYNRNRRLLCCALEKELR